MNTKKTVLCYGVAFVILFALFFGLFGVLLNEFTSHNTSEWIDKVDVVQSSVMADAEDPYVTLMLTKGDFLYGGSSYIQYFRGGSSESFDLKSFEGSAMVIPQGYKFVCWSTNQSYSGKLPSTIVSRSAAGSVIYGVVLPEATITYEIYCEGTDANIRMEKTYAPYFDLDLSLDSEIAQEVQKFVQVHSTWPRSVLDGFYASVTGEKITRISVPEGGGLIKVKYVSPPAIILHMVNGSFMQGGATCSAYFYGGTEDVIDLKSWEGSTMVIPDGYTFICWSSTPQYSGKLFDTVIPKSAAGNTYYAIVLPDVTLSIDVFCRDDVASQKCDMTFPSYSTVDLSDGGEVYERVQSEVSKIMKWPQSVWDGFYSSRDGEKITSFTLGETDAMICAAYKVKSYITYWYLGADGFSWYDERVYYHDADEVIDMSIGGYSGYEAAEALGIELIGFSDNFAGAVDDDNMFGQEYVHTTLYACYSCTVDIGFVSAKKGVDGTAFLNNMGSGAEIAPRQTYSGQYIALPQSVQEYIAKFISSGKCDRVDPKLVDAFMLDILMDDLQYSGNMRLFDMLAPTDDMQIPTVTVYSFQKFLSYAYKYAQNVSPEFDEQLDLATYNVVLVPTSGGSVVFDDDGDGVPNKTTGDKISDWFGNLWNGIKESTVFQKAKVAIMIVLGVLAVVLILPLIPYLIQAVIFVVMLPIKAIRAIAKAVKKNKQ